MRTTTVTLLLAVMLTTSGTALAQDTGVRDSLEVRVKTELSKIEEMLKVIQLPGQAEEAREAGVPDEDIRVILEESARRKLPPADTEIILEESITSVRENGPVDNFGAFVQMKLDEGLRGRDLAAAIHQEHRLRGKGKGHGKGQAKDNKHIKGKRSGPTGQADLDRDIPRTIEEADDKPDDRDERKKKEKGNK